MSYKTGMRTMLTTIVLTFGFVLLLVPLLPACNSGSSAGRQDAGGLDATLLPADSGLESQVTVLETLDIFPFNDDLAPGQPTVDIAFYITELGPLTWAELASNITRAKRILSEAGVSIRVTSALRISVPASWQSLDPDEVTMPTTPEFVTSDLYAHLNELQTRVTLRNEAIFEAITSYFPVQASGVTAENTIHVITLNEAPIAYYDWDGSEWSYQTAPTGGLSFPPYAYADRIPAGIRGVITLSFQQAPFFPETRVLSHEIGHKIINVSHEGVGVCPAFAANGPELMLYGDGENIPSTEAGRWHRERLLLSPFLYTLEQGVAMFQDRYQNGGVYRDEVYGNYIVSPICPPETK
ncbi:MAG: hypothetical protein JKY56_04190 [Kofleriaceae bacterium]|nr:hypothetical protein [Kofleriaceae bacterium]